MNVTAPRIGLYSSPASWTGNSLGDAAAPGRRDGDGVDSLVRAGRSSYLIVAR